MIIAVVPLPERMQVGVGDGDCGRVGVFADVEGVPLAPHETVVDRWRLAVGGQVPREEPDGVLPTVPRIRMGAARAEQGVVDALVFVVELLVDAGEPEPSVAVRVQAVLGQAGVLHVVLLVEVHPGAQRVGAAVWCVPRPPGASRVGGLVQQPLLAAVGAGGGGVDPVADAAAQPPPVRVVLDQVGGIRADVAVEQPHRCDGRDVHDAVLLVLSVLVCRSLRQPLCGT
jgi:hypothetical protein